MQKLLSDYGVPGTERGKTLKTNWIIRVKSCTKINKIKQTI